MGLESGLHKMDVVRPCVEALIVLHCDERNAIDQTPCFICSRSIQVKRPREQVGVKTDYRCVFIRKDIFDHIDSFTTEISRERIAYLE